MRYGQFKQLAAVMALAAMCCLTAAAQSRFSGVGTPATADDEGPRAWTSGRSGSDLPPGKGSAKDGARIYLVKCSMCHGQNGEGVKWKPMAFSPIHAPRLFGGNSTPHFNRKPDQVTTLAYYAPWATVIFNTIATEMPEFNAGSLKPDEVYALTALILFKNNIVKEDDVMDRETLPKVQMPNRNSFPASDEIYMDMAKRGCIKTFGECRDP
jgi:mono/diheme cytochrome c family protein